MLVPPILQFNCSHAIQALNSVAHLDQMFVFVLRSVASWKFMFSRKTADATDLQTKSSVLTTPDNFYNTSKCKRNLMFNLIPDNLTVALPHLN